MSVLKIANRYAKALLDEALEKNILQEIYGDVKTIQKSIDDSRELKLFLKSPIINADKKQSVVKEIYDGKVNKLTVDFLDTLVVKRREGLLKEVTEAFEEAYNQLKGITKVKLTTAVEVSSEIEEELMGKIKSEFNLTNIDVTKSVDADILGGFIIQFDDKIYDNSVAHRINTIERSIIS